MFGIDNQFELLAYFIGFKALEELFSSKKKRERNQ